MKHVLLVDSEIEQIEDKIRDLGLENIKIDSVSEPEQAYRRSQAVDYDLFILGLILSHESGYTLLKRLRHTTNAPVLLLTVMCDDIDRIVGLELGADDFLDRDCHWRELSARISRLLYRNANPRRLHSKNGHLRVGDTELDEATHNVVHAGTLIELTVTEYRLLKALMYSAGEVVNKNTLSQLARGKNLAAYDRSIDAVICNLRRKLTSRASSSPIYTIRGIGYQFISEENSYAFT